MIHVQNCGEEGYPDFPGTVGWQIHPDVAPQPGELILQKGVPDAFAETPLDAILQALQVTDVIVAGLQTEFCIQATSRRAVELGYSVTLVADAHSTFDNGATPASTVVAQVNEALGRILTISPAAALAW